MYVSHVNIHAYSAAFICSQTCRNKMLRQPSPHASVRLGTTRSLCEPKFEWLFWALTEWRIDKVFAALTCKPSNEHYTFYIYCTLKIYTLFWKRDVLWGEGWMNQGRSLSKYEYECVVGPFGDLAPAPEQSGHIIPFKSFTQLQSANIRFN